jgi:hypothetical protein
MNKTPELFSDFEVYKYSRGPIMTKLIGASFALHIAFLALVIFVPAVRDVLLIASIFSDTDFVERDYKKTKIGREDVTVLDFSKFTYPEGYFALAHQEEAASAPQPQIIQEAKPQPTPKPLPKQKAPPNAAQLAKNKKKNNIGEAVGNKGGDKDGTATAANNKGDNSKAEDDKDKTDKADADKKTDDVAKADDIAKAETGSKDFNKKPLKDFGAELKKRDEEGKLNLKEPFEVEIRGELDADGKLQNAKYEPKQGGEEIGRMGGELIAALNDSNLLSKISEVLNKNNKKPHKLGFNIKRDTSQFVVTLEIEAESPDVASIAASGLGFSFLIGAKAREGKDEGTLLEKTKATARGKMVVINTILSNEIVDPMIQRQLALAKQESGK